MFMEIFQSKGLSVPASDEMFMNFLAHLSQRLIGELIGYPWSGVRRRPASFVICPQFQTSSPLKLLGQSKPNFMWSLLGKGERKFI